MAVVDKLKKAACDAIDSHTSQLRLLSEDIWDHPELCFEEHFAHKRLTDFLEERGFSVERGFVVPTAFRAKPKEAKRGGGDQGPNIAVLCEYDALPGIGHACGHNLIGTVGIATSLGIQAALLSPEYGGNGELTVLGSPAEEGGGGKIDLIQAGAFLDVDLAMMAHPSQLTVLGTPAEEGGGGKINLINAGAFKEVDLAMMAHPSQLNLPKPTYLSLNEVKITYRGKEAHASSHPWSGVNALDAAVMCYTNISHLRQQMRPTWRVHGVITNGGVKPNIIPAVAELLYYLRAPTDPELKMLNEKVIGCIEGAARATGCQVEYQFDPKGYSSLMSSNTMATLYAVNGEKAGVKIEKDPEKLRKAGGSTDMGNVSHVVPSIHPKYHIGTMASQHTPEFATQSRTSEAVDYSLKVAKALAMTAIDFLMSPQLVKQAKEEFAAALEAEKNIEVN